LHPQEAAMHPSPLSGTAQIRRLATALLTGSLIFLPAAVTADHDGT
jgi:hypothetical protein